MILALFLGLFFVVVGGFIFTQGGRILGYTLAMVGLMIWVCSFAPSRAHDHSRPELDGWFKSLAEQESWKLL